MLTLQLSHSYVKTDETTGKKSIVFVYKIRGSKEALAAYKKDKQSEVAGQDNYREDDSGNALYFSSRGFYNGKALKKSTKSGKYNPDTTEVDALKSMVDAYGVDVAKILASGLMGKSAAPIAIEDQESEKLD